jgi:hypothetical protein
MWGEKKLIKYSLKIIAPSSVLLFVGLLFIQKTVVQGDDLLEVLRQKQFDFNNMALTYKAGSYIAIPTFNGTVWGFVTMVPKAVYNALFMPTVFRCTSAIMMLNVVENWCLVALLIYTLFYFDRPSHTQRYRLFAAVLFVISLASIIGVSTPVIGAIVRYKIPLLPFLILIIISCISKHAPLNKLLNTWQTKLHL